MSQITRKSSMFLAALALAAVGCIFTSQAFAQQKTVEQKQTGPSQFQVDTRNTTVAYIEGNHLVVRLADGTLEAIRIPAGERFNIDGDRLTLHELKPGMILTEQTFTTTRPIVVKTVEITDGTVWHASPTRLAIRTKENKVVDYTIPEWATVTVNGEETSLHTLRRGQTITATIITEEPLTVSERSVRSHGHHAMTEQKESSTAMETTPAATKPAQPTETQPATQTQATETPEKLPNTASQMPLIGLLGLVAVAMSLGLRAFRKAL